MHQCFAELWWAGIPGGCRLPSSAYGSTAVALPWRDEGAINMVPVDEPASRTGLGRPRQWVQSNWCFLLLFQIYMSPEVILCRGHSTKADIYSLGATLIHMQTGTPPWVKRYPRSAYPSYLYIVSEGPPGLRGRDSTCSGKLLSFLSASGPWEAAGNSSTVDEASFSQWRLC